MSTLVDQALSRVEELGTIGAMKWLEQALTQPADDCPLHTKHIAQYEAWLEQALAQPEPSPWHPLNGDGKGFEGHVLMRHVNGELTLSHSNWTGPELCQSSTPAYRVMREYGYRHWTPVPAFKLKEKNT